MAAVISDKAGPIGFLATILLWVKAYAAYLSQINEVGSWHIASVIAVRRHV
jgi:hypothetical protein